MSQTIMSESNRPILAAELIDIIVDFLHDDEQALAACSLACRVFLPAARLHLLARVHLRCDTRAKHVQKFLSFLHSPSIEPYIQSLKIVGMQCAHGWPPRRWTQKRHNFDRLNSLPKLTSLSINHTSFDMKQFPTLVQPWCERITSLYMRDSGFHDFYNFVGFIALFTSLERLVLNDTVWAKESADSGGRVSSTLRALTLEESYNRPILGWLLLHDPIPPLHTIVMTSSNWEELSVAGKVFRELGPSLRRLDLTFPYGYSIPDVTAYRTINLSPNTELRSLSLGKIGNVTDNPNAGAHIPLILSQVTSAHLETVTLTFFDVKSSRQLSDAVWAGIDRVFELPAYAHLRRIRIVIDEIGGSANEDIQLTIWQQLRSCHARGLLSFG